MCSINFGPVQFRVFPLNVQSLDHVTQTDWSRKEIAGAAIHREWVGEGDEEIRLKGKLFPHFFAREAKRRGQQDTSGGLADLGVLENMRRAGQAQLLIRGTGDKLGWFVIDRLARSHQLLHFDGIGQQVDFDAQFQRVPVPDPVQFITDLWQP